MPNARDKKVDETIAKIQKELEAQKRMIALLSKQLRSLKDERSKISNDK